MAAPTMTGQPAAQARPLAVVTGGGRGIGAATAIALARDGWALVLGYRSDHEAAERTLDDCVRAGAKVQLVQ